MNMTEIKELAKKMGVKSGTLKKVELVRALQISEGNVPCFMIGKSADCGQSECLWKADCN